MILRLRGQAALVLALVGAALAALDVIGGLMVDGGYTAELAYVHLLVVGAGVAGVVIGVWRQWPGTGEARGPLPASCALLLGAQAPWSLAGVAGRPWFAVAGVAASAALASALLLSTTWSPSVVVSPWLAAVRRRRLSHGRPASGAPAVAARTGAGPSSPGWYPDPDADDAPCWRWWDGRGWTEHRSPSASG